MSGASKVGVKFDDEDPGMGNFVLKSTASSVDTSLGLVFGWGIICKEGGTDYFDLHEHHIPENVMLKAVSNFMLGDRTNKNMHAGEHVGTVVHSYPLTEEIAKAHGITSERYGWLVAVKPDSADVVAKFKTGEYTGFSIGGSARMRDA